MSRENAPLGLGAAVARVNAKAKQFLTESEAAGKPINWGRTFVEPDKNVYITADQEKDLIAKWEKNDCGSDKCYCKGSGSSGGAQVDLKLQLEGDWDTWKKGTSPFVYHIPIDVYYSPADKKREEDSRNQKAASAQKKLDDIAAAKAAAEAKVKQDEIAKKRKVQEDKKAQDLATAWNADLKAKKVKPADKAKFDKAWLEKFGARYTVK